MIYPAPDYRRRSIQSSYYFSERTPNIRNQIIVNSSHLNALEDYYRNKYLTESEEHWKLRLPDTTEFVQVELLDGVRTDETGHGPGVTPAIVRRQVFKEGEVEMTMTRAIEGRNERSLNPA